MKWSLKIGEMPVLLQGEFVGVVNVGEVVANQAAEKDIAAANREAIHVESN